MLIKGNKEKFSKENSFAEGSEIKQRDRKLFQYN
jgi:hypothetical protein